MQAPATGWQRSAWISPPPAHVVEVYCANGRHCGVDMTPLRLEVLTELRQADKPMN